MGTTQAWLSFFLSRGKGAPRPTDRNGAKCAGLSVWRTGPDGRLTGLAARRAAANRPTGSPEDGDMTEAAQIWIAMLDDDMKCNFASLRQYFSFWGYFAGCVIGCFSSVCASHLAWHFSRLPLRFPIGPRVLFLQDNHGSKDWIPHLIGLLGLPRRRRLQRSHIGRPRSLFVPRPCCGTAWRYCQLGVLPRLSSGLKKAWMQ